MIPANSFKCTGYCPDCLMCWKADKGQSIEFKKH